ncbi:MAG: MATE family efflux transporter [Marinibacterium sp.]|nr:MATE family efflux transporter [Marinibacterium sp.]
MHNMMLSAPVLPQMLRLAGPNLLAMLFTTGAAVVETYYFGRLGIEQLAGHAVVFPLIMLQHMMAGGSLGGSVASAMSRAIGARNHDRIRAMGLHALILGVLVGLGITGLLWAHGGAVLQTLGASGAVLGHAQAYLSTVLFAIPAIWIMNALISVLRGTGDMVWPARLLIAMALLQSASSYGFGFVLGMGITGIALGQVLAFWLGAALALVLLLGRNASAGLRLDPRLLDGSLFRELLRTGGLACLSPLQSTMTAMVLTAYVAPFGAATIAGYGIGARLEFLLIPIAFSIGTGALPMAGIAVGAGQHARARVVGWTGGLLGGAVLGCAGVTVALFPDLWTGIFTDDLQVRAVAASYFAWAGPGYAFLGFGLCLYFAFQGAGQVIWPILAGTLRLGIVVGAGYLMRDGLSTVTPLFSVIFVSMVGFALMNAWRFSRLRQ